MQKKQGIACAVLAAVFYALNAPVSKILLQSVGQSMMAALLYLGCGLGMGAIGLLGRSNPGGENRLTRKELPYALAMILLDVAAPVALMFGLSCSSAESVSLLNNFEIVATTMIALVFFGEKVSGRLWMGIGLVTIGSAFGESKQHPVFRTSNTYLSRSGVLFAL